MNEMWEQMRRASEGNKQDQVELLQRIKEDSRKDLCRIVTTKIRTSFIGALSAFEETFGEVWGHKKKAGERTPEERRWYEKWQAARTRVLNGGNNQIRAIESEFEMYEILWKRHQFKMSVNREQEQQPNG